METRLQRTSKHHGYTAKQASTNLSDIESVKSIPYKSTNLKPVGLLQLPVLSQSCKLVWTIAWN